MGEHIKECIAICNKDIVAKDEIIKQFEDRWILRRGFGTFVWQSESKWKKAFR